MGNLFLRDVVHLLHKSWMFLTLKKTNKLVLAFDLLSYLNTTIPTHKKL